jgi:hypothetical protein
MVAMSFGLALAEPSNISCVIKKLAAAGASKLLDQVGVGEISCVSTPLKD